MFIVYVLFSLKDKKRYIGFTSNLERRLTEHNSGKVKSTKNRKPFELVYSEEFTSKTDAMNREKFFKSGKGREFLTLIDK
jgi:putative endonuclease